MVESLDLAFRSLVRNPTRTGLTVLGLAIGVAAFIAMVAFGSGARASVVGQFEKLGVNTMSIHAHGFRADGRPATPLGDADLRTLELEAQTVDFFVPVYTGGARVSAGNQSASVPLRATTPEYLTLMGWRAQSGGNFDALDVRHRSRVCLLGANTAQTLFGPQDPLGQSIDVQGRMRCRVIGVLRRNGKATSGRDLDDFIVFPYTTYRAYLADASAPFVAIDLRPKPGVDRDDVQAELTRILRQAHGLAASEEPDFKLSSRDDAIQVADTVASILTALLGAIAGVSLLVGGIGIMNIQLVSVTERTQEIGIRAAIGAPPALILRQFLMEAIVLALVGTVAGTLVGTTAALIVSSAMHWPTHVPWDAIAIAVLFGAATGVAFGYLPARRAASLDPIEALRRE